jgi:putative addiction module CopG family antidote
MNVSLTPELEKLVQKKVQTGRYTSASEVIREALRLMEPRDEMPIIGKEAFIDGMEITRKLHLHARRVIIEGVLDVTAPLPKHMRESWKKFGLEE